MIFRVKVSVPSSASIRSSRLLMFCKISVFKIFTKLTGEPPCWYFFFNKVSRCRPVNSLKKKIRHRCFPVNFCEILKNPFFTERFRAIASGELVEVIWSSSETFWKLNRKWPHCGFVFPKSLQNNFPEKSFHTEVFCKNVF